MMVAQDNREQKTVLIVEDQTSMCAILHSFVQDAFPGITFLQAINGSDALELCALSRPQLVLMDIGLPDANGIVLTARLMAQWPEIKVIIVSIHKESIYVEQALEAGAFAYIAKDMIHQELLPHMAGALGLALPPHATGSADMRAAS